MSTPATSQKPDANTKRLVVVSAGTGDPSSTRMLAARIAQKSLDLLRDFGIPATVHVIELGPLAVDVARATVAGFPGEHLQAAIDGLAGADAIIAATPVYKAGSAGCSSASPTYSTMILWWRSRFFWRRPAARGGMPW